MRRTLKKALLLAAVGFLLWFGWSVWRAAGVVTAYKAKMVCSGVFVSHRSLESLVSEDVAAFSWAGVDVNWTRKSASSSFVGLVRREAVFRNGLGCTLELGPRLSDPRAEDDDGSDFSGPHSAGLPWPVGDEIEPTRDASGIDREKLARVIHEAFLEPDTGAPRRTRAVVVLYGGDLVAERYAPGFSASTPLPGWSMTKSVIHALLGVLVAEGRLDPNEPPPIPEWSDPSDPRHSITLDQLLRMSSGLEFEERYLPPSQATTMLFATTDAGAYAASMPLESPPGTQWKYSSGTTNILSRMLRDLVGEKRYARFPRQALFDPIGMASAILEPDPSGTFVGSSFMYATARDWARFGLLYLRDGVWEGRRILPPGWADQARTPSPLSSKGRYGAHFWLNAGDPPGSSNRIWPSLPADAFFASGFQGQTVLIIPSRDLVLVRLGLTEDRAAFDMESFAAGVLQALPTPPGVEATEPTPNRSPSDGERP